MLLRCPESAPQGSAQPLRRHVVLAPFFKGQRVGRLDGLLCGHRFFGHCGKARVLGVAPGQVQQRIARLGRLVGAARQAHA